MRFPGKGTAVGYTFPSEAYHLLMGYKQSQPAQVISEEADECLSAAWMYEHGNLSVWLQALELESPSYHSVSLVLVRIGSPSALKVDSDWLKRDQLISSSWVCKLIWKRTQNPSSAIRSHYENF